MRGSNDADLAVGRNRHPYLRGHHPARAFLDAQIRPKTARLRAFRAVVDYGAIARRIAAGLAGSESAGDH